MDAERSARRCQSPARGLRRPSARVARGPSVGGVVLRQARGPCPVDRAPRTEAVAFVMDHSRRWEIEFRKPTWRPGHWRLSGVWPRRMARLALADLRHDLPAYQWRLLWNGLVVDPPPYPLIQLPTRRS